MGIAQPQLVTRGYNEKQIPWFYMLNLGPFAENSAIKSWIMEYHPQFLSEWNPSDKVNPSIKRSQVLSRYIAMLPNIPAEPIVTEISGLTLALDNESVAMLRGICKDLGYRCTMEDGEIVLTGPDIVLRLITQSSASRGIKRVEFHVSRMPEGKREFQFGSHSVLRFENDKRAVWTF